MSSYRMKYKIGATQYHIPVQEDIAGFGSGVPLGTILPYSANSEYPPEGFLFCDGSAVSRAAYPDLFSLIGTTYGSGDGVSTFNLPDLGFLTGIDFGTSDTAPVIYGAQYTYSNGTYVSEGIKGKGVGVNHANPKYYANLYYFDKADYNDPGPLQNVGQQSENVQPLFADLSDSSLTYSSTVRYIIKAFSATSSNSELVDVTELSTEITKKFDPSTDFTFVYPNNGTEQNPANVTTSNRYVLSNPFPGYYVHCVAEVLFASQWGPTEQYLDKSSSTYNVYGIKAAQVTPDSIAVKTGNAGVLGNNVYSNTPIDTSSMTSAPSSLPCRVKVWKVGKIPQSS